MKEKPLSAMRRQPQQKRSRERVEKILDAAAEIFAEIGYDAATTHDIANRAETAIGSLYQFFPDKLAIFQALELRHLERVREMTAKVYTPETAKLPLEESIDKIMKSSIDLIQQPTSRVVFLQFFTERKILKTFVDDSLTWEIIRLWAKLFHWRNPNLSLEFCELLAQVCVNAGNTLLVIALRSDPQRREAIYQQIRSLLLAYLTPHIGDEIIANQVMKKVMKCPRCDSQKLAKNGHRHGKQRYLCKECGRQFLARSKQK